MKTVVHRQQLQQTKDVQFFHAHNTSQQHAQYLGFDRLFVDLRHKAALPKFAPLLLLFHPGSFGLLLCLILIYPVYQVVKALQRLRTCSSLAVKALLHTATIMRTAQCVKQNRASAATLYGACGTGLHSLLQVPCAQTQQQPFRHAAYMCNQPSQHRRGSTHLACNGQPGLGLWHRLVLVAIAPDRWLGGVGLEGALPPQPLLLLCFELRHLARDLLSACQLFHSAGLQGPDILSSGIEGE